MSGEVARAGRTRWLRRAPGPLPPVRGSTLVALVVVLGCQGSPRPRTPDAAAAAAFDARPTASATLGRSKRAAASGAPQPTPSPAVEPSPGSAPPPSGCAHDARQAHGAVLAVPGHLPAVVRVPASSCPPDGPQRRPVLVATHGAGGSPERHCDWWAELVGDRAFVLCPRGSAINRYFGGEAAGYFYPSHLALARELEAAFDALVRQFPDEIDPRAPVYAGFSQGASMGALMLPGHRLGFARAALVEGGFGQFQEWNVAAARRFRERAGLRVLLACGRLACLEQARPTSRHLEQGGLESQLLYVPAAGHSLAEPMQRAVREGLAWLVAGDARWERPGPVETPGQPARGCSGVEPSRPEN